MVQSQVVGRVHQGHEALEELNTAMVDDDRPNPPIVLTSCGLTDARVRKCLMILHLAGPKPEL